MNTRWNVFSFVLGVLRSVIEGAFSEMKPNHRRCSGIDVHKNSVTVCVLAPVGERHIETKKRKFRIFTRDLKQLRACLKHCQVTEIAWNRFVSPACRASGAIRPHTSELW